MNKLAFYNRFGTAFFVAATSLSGVLVYFNIKNSLEMNEIGYESLIQVFIFGVLLSQLFCHLINQRLYRSYLATEKANSLVMIHQHEEMSQLYDTIEEINERFVKHTNCADPDCAVCEYSTDLDWQISLFRKDARLIEMIHKCQLSLCVKEIKAIGEKAHE